MLKEVPISVELYNAIVAYLIRQPFADVHMLIGGLQQAAAPVAQEAAKSADKAK